MKVLHIVTAFPRHEGDVITPWLVEMLRGLKRRGVEVEVFVSSYRGLGDQILWNIHVHRFRYFLAPWENLTHEEMAVDRLTRSPLHRILPAFYLIFGCLKVWRLCRRRKYSVIHVHWPLPHALFGWVAKMACRAKMVSTFYGAEVRWAKHSRLPFLKGFISWAAGRSEDIIAISNYTASEVRSMVEAPIKIIPYTIGFSDKERGQVSSRILQEGKIESKKRLILTVGRLVERKGIRYLIDALKFLSASLEVELVIVGGGPLREELQAYAREKGLSDKVRFAGRVSEEELEGFYRQASVYVQPAIFDSRGDTEMLGVTILEAMHHGVPVIASEVGGIGDIVKDRETGLLVPQKDPKSLAKAIDEILEDPKLSSKLAHNARVLLNTKFSWNNILENIIKVYK